MPENLDLYDIQGNIVKGYGRFAFVKARYVFYRIHDEVKGRKFVDSLLIHLTTSEAWGKNTIPIPKVTTNIAFTYSGLKNLGVPRQSLQSFPEEFAMGMKGRKDILGDDGSSSPENWDPIWQEESQVDIWISINGPNEEAVEERYQLITKLVAATEGGIEQLKGHVGGHRDYQEGSSLSDENGNIIHKEHFGYSDGISDPYFEGSSRNPIAVIGGGKPKRLPPDAPLETGEFILGYKDEAQEYPIAPMPPLLAYNGTFMVYRKLHQNVASFNNYIEEVGQHFPGGKEALAAKFAGRWRNGAPLTTFPTKAEADEFMGRLEKIEHRRHEIQAELETATEPQKTKLMVEKAKLDEEFYPMRSKLVAFNYNDDLSGSKCPMGAHVRRVNPRGALEWGQKDAFKTPGALVDRRRMLRRGLPYGKADNPPKDNGNHGIVFMTIVASIKRQFEFVQQQWINYGNDFKLANDKDPLLGNHEMTPDGQGKGRMVIEATKAKGGEAQKPPFFCSNLKRFVETRGGDYFFVPSMTALRMIAQGIIDPT